MNLKNALRVILAVTISLTIVTSGCVDGTAEIDLDSSYSVDSYNDSAMTVTYLVEVTAINTGTMKARDVSVSAIMRQDDGQLQTSNTSVARYEFGTLDPGISTTMTSYCTLEGESGTYNDLKNGTNITLITVIGNYENYRWEILDCIL